MYDYMCIYIYIYMFVQVVVNSFLGDGLYQVFNVMCVYMYISIT